MDKKIGRPHEGFVHRNSDDADGVVHRNGEDAGGVVHRNDERTDTEGHGLSSLPGTGGDSLNPRRPSSGGEFGDEDIEGPTSVR